MALQFLAPIVITTIILSSAKLLGVTAFDQLSASRQLPRNIEPISTDKIPEEYIRIATERLQPRFAEIDMHTKSVISRILDTFRRYQVDQTNFAGIDGYGHGDLGRETLDNIYADLMGAESAIVRVQAFSGTHAITAALFSALRPGDILLGVSGRPYDTLEEVIGIREPLPDDVPLMEDMDSGSSSSSYHSEREPNQGSNNNNSVHPMKGLIGHLKEWGVKYLEVPLFPDGTFNLNAIDAVIDKHRQLTQTQSQTQVQPQTGTGAGAGAIGGNGVRMLHVQRSCGYSWRKSIPICEIERLVRHIRSKYGPPTLTRPYNPFLEKQEGIEIEGKNAVGEAPPLPLSPIIFCDNCYGEFVEEREPTSVGVDLIAGSMIKNPGGTLAPTGGYVAGSRKLVKAARNRLAAPGVGGGATMGQNRLLYQGLFLSPTIVGESLKGMELITDIFGRQLGLRCNPDPARGDKRTDIIQAIQLGQPDALIALCKSIQRLSPISSFVVPVPGYTSGYGDEVIFADGTFVEGSTLELTADGPLREPYTIFMQGCMHWTHWSLVLEDALKDILPILIKRQQQQQQQQQEGDKGGKNEEGEK